MVASRMSISLVLGAWLALGACTGGDDDGGGAAAASGAAGDDGNASAPREGGGRAVEALVDVFCDTIERCCPTAPISRARCESSFDDPPLFMTLRAGTAVVVEPAFGSCLAALRRQSEMCGQPLEDTSSCRTAFNGTRGEGESCADGVECARDERVVLCVKTGDPAGPEPPLGVCHTLTHARQGEPCQFSIESFRYATHVRPANANPSPLLGYCDRDEGLRCDGSQTCVPSLAIGAACRGHHECEPGLYCDQTCRPLEPEGAACKTGTTVCETGLLCIEGRCAVYAPDRTSCATMSALPPVL